jgi:SAM-dependent methyltransferase
MDQTISPDEAKQITVQSYNNHLEEYVNKDSTDDVRTLAYWPGVEYFLDQLPKGQQILEIGSGTGADALRIERKGFKVHRTDIAEAFIKHMRSNGYEAKTYDVLAAPYPIKQTAIFANAVFLHFTLEQFRTALGNVHTSLTEEGLLCMGMKLGDFEGWREKGLSGKRYFKFWQLQDLQTELAHTGFKVVHTYTTPNNDFAVITTKKA